MKKLPIFLLISTLFLTSCSSKKIQITDNVKGNVTNSVSKEQNNGDTENKNEDENSNNSFNKDNEGKNNTIEVENISKEVKNYILNGQEDKSEAQKLKWSKIFLNEVNIDSLYQEYIKNGGEKNNIEELALYITENAPILSNWEELFKKDLFNSYGEEVIKL